MIGDPEIINNGALAGWMRAVLQAEMAFVRARERLQTVKEDAVLRGRYDPDAYDAAMATHLEARAWATIVRTAWRCWKAEHGKAVSLTLR